MDALKDREELFVICVNYISAGPLDGGCYGVAKVLQENLGGELYTLWGKTRGSDLSQHHHVLLKIGDRFLDSDGLASEDRIKKTWEEKEGIRDIDFLPFHDVDVPDSPRDESFLRALRHYFQSVIETDPIETAQRRSKVYKLNHMPEKEIQPVNAIDQVLASQKWVVASSQDINNDHSRPFAEDLLQITGGQLWETRSDGDLQPHVFLKWKDKFYDALTPQGVRNWKHLEVFRPELELYHELRDCHSGQNDCTIYAKKDGEVVGYLDFSHYQGEPFLLDIQVIRRERRKGIASELVFGLQKQYPGIEINYEVFSETNRNFFDALPKLKIPVTDVIEAKKKLAEVREKLAEYTRKSKLFDSIESPTPQQIEDFWDETKDWNDFHNKESQLEWSEHEASHILIVDVPTSTTELTQNPGQDRSIQFV